MRPTIVLVLACALAGCGVETAGTAAAVATMKKQELEQGKKTMQDAQQKIDAAAKQVEASSAAADSDK